MISPLLIATLIRHHPTNYQHPSRRRCEGICVGTIEITAITTPAALGAYA
ncbi:hypothetical protein [Iningainema tapete]|uniref:Uncharacterized protein n=1 Tax=Iningainema tapete BLCC-T55 TaxID=2748662 RepID=A0A8J6XGW0_9CYAN|nr:hypothetical protein [Iningainema tapete]MBD2776570.1 hypothetical protein [Iningainema tapete BLCC-T55]